MNKTRTLIKLKRQAFQDNRSEFIKLHKDLSRSIVAAAPATVIPENALEIIDSYYSHLEKHQAILDYLSETNQIIIDHFITRPYDKLQAEWLERSNTDLINKDPELSYASAIKILDDQASKAQNELDSQKLQAPSESTLAALDYIKCMGQIIGSTVQFIILQYVSENIEFAPPMLNTFEQKMQTAVYKQLQEFLAELEMDADLEKVAAGMKKQLESDKDIFDAVSFDELEEKFPAAHIVNELEGYFNARYLSRR